LVIYGKLIEVATTNYGLENAGIMEIVVTVGLSFGEL
jgi:hypothetical protein